MAQKPLILAINSNQRNLELLEQFLGEGGCQVVGVSRLAEIDQTLKANSAFNLALVDIMGFDRQIWEQCAALHQADIPFFVISPRQSNALQQESLKHGAKGVLVKPFIIKELLTLIHGVVNTN